jgi:hypothetical protein
MKIIKKIVSWGLALVKTPPLPGVSYTFGEETWLSHGMWKTGAVDKLRTSDITYPEIRVYRESWKERLVSRAYPPHPGQRLFGIIH